MKAKCAKQKYDHPAEEKDVKVLSPAKEDVKNKVTIEEALPDMLNNIKKGFIDCVNPVNIVTTVLSAASNPVNFAVDCYNSGVAIGSTLSNGTEEERIAVESYLLGAALGGYVVGEVCNSAGKILDNVSSLGEAGKVETVLENEIKGELESLNNNSIGWKVGDPIDTFTKKRKLSIMEYSDAKILEK